MDTRLNYVILSFVLIICTNVIAQEKSSINHKIDLLVDSLWNLDYNQVDNFKSISEELIEIGKQNKIYKASVNGAQGLGEYYHRISDFENAHLNYSEARELARKANDKREEGHALISLASIAYDRNRIEESKSYYFSGIENWKELKDTNQLCYSYLRYAQKLSSLDEHSNAIDAFLIGCDYCKVANNKGNYAACLSGMSIVHKKQKNLSKAIELSNESLNISRGIKDDWAICTELNNLGILYKDIKNYDKARLTYNEGFAISKTFDFPPLEKSFMVNIGILDNLENNHESALKNLNDAYPIASSEKDLVSMSDILNEISKSYIGLKQFEIANDTVQKAIKYAQTSRSLEKEWQAWDTQYLIYKNMNKNELALNALEQYQVINDSIYRIEKTAEIDRLQTEFETEKKEQEIKHLEAQAILDASRKKWLSLGLIGLSLAALAIIYTIVLKRKKDKKLHLAAIELKDSENIRLEEALHHERKELTEKALHLAQKNELLSSLKNDLKSIRNEKNETEVKVLSNKIRFDEQMDQNWEQFLIAFKNSKQGFFKSLSSKHPEVGKNDLRLSALLSMNLGSKEIASILNISDMGVKKARYRLRKKLNLKSDDNLEQYLAKI